MNAHPAADLFPLMDDDELRQLAGDIAANGQREAIVMHEGLILDGRNRWLACEGVDITPVTRQFDPARDGTSPVAYVLSANLHRRHLTQSQKAEIARKAVPMFKDAARERMLAGKRTDPSPLIDEGLQGDGRAVAQAAKAVGVSPSYVYTAQRIADEAPDLHEQVEAGVLSLATAQRQLKRRQPPASKGGDTTKKPKRTEPRPAKPMSDAEYDRQLADAERQTRAAFAYEALEHLGRCRFEPAEVATAIPANQRHRIDEYLKRSLDWLTEFHRIWTADDPA